MKKHTQGTLALGVSVLILSGMIVAPIKNEIAKADVTDPGFTDICTDDEGGSSNSNNSSGSTSAATKNGQKYKPTDFQMPDFGDETPKAGQPDYSLCKKIADAVGKAVGCDPKFVFAQMGEETSWGGAPGASAPRDGEHNLTGIGYVSGTPGAKGGSEHGEGDGAYGAYDSWQHYAMAYASILANMLDGNDQAKHDPKAFIHALKQHGYFTDSEQHYLAGFLSDMSKYDSSSGNNQALSAGNGNVSASTGADSSGSSDNDNPNCSSGNGGGSSTTSDNGSVVGIARSMMGWFHYPNPDRHNVQLCTKNGKLNSKDDLKKDGITDCSGFVWIVLKLAGYNVPAGMGWFTGTMAQDAKGPHKWFKKIDPKDAKPGDVIIVNEGSGEGENGHTAIITENWHGYDTKCINEGGDDETIFHNDGVCEDTIQRQFGSMLQGGDVTIAEPVKGNSK